MQSVQGLYRFRIGTINATAILDGSVSLPSPLFGVNVAPEQVATYLGGYHLPRDLVVMPITCVLLDTREARLLIDTGLGAYVLPGTQPDAGKLRSSLAYLGVEPAAIDVVFLTHAHPDHIGGLRDGAGQPFFRNARHLLHEQDWDFWTGQAPADDPVTSFFFQVASENLLPLADRIERFTGVIEVVPGVRTVEAWGHTPGHTGLLVESGGERLFCMGDNAPHYKIGFEHPDWYYAIEVDPVRALATKDHLLEWVDREQIKVFGSHHPFPGLGYVVQEVQAKRWRWTPAG